MTTAAWVLAAALGVALFLLDTAIEAYSDLAQENRQLRAENARLRRHPSLPASTDGGAA